jgi:hypothetical protein
MAYAKGSVISQNDLQPFNIRMNNFVWGTGFTENGYGQTPLTTQSFTFGDVIRPAPWKQTIDTIENALKHQGTSYSMSYPPQTGQPIEYDSRLSTNLELAIANKFNAATTGVPVSSSITSTQSFNNTQLITFIAYFGTGADVDSHNKARYFFNAGGQFNISLSHPSPMSTISANLGSIRFGAGNQTIAGVNYTGTTKVGGTFNDYSVLQSSKSFYNLQTGGIPGEGYTTPDVILAVQGEIGTTASIYVYVKYNGFGLLTFRIATYAPNTNPTIPAGSFAQLTARQPPTTYITNSWGPITIGSDITQASVSTAQWYLFASSGSMVVPAGKTTARVILIGGGGCGETATGLTIKGGGGGGAGQVRDTAAFSVTAGQTLSWTVGAGGQGFAGYAGNGTQTVLYGSSNLGAFGGIRGGGVDGSTANGSGGGSGSGYSGGQAYSYGRQVYAGGGGGGAGYFGFGAAQAGTVFQGEGGIGGVGVTLGPINGNYYNVGGGGQGGMNRQITNWTLADETGYKYGGGLGGVNVADGLDGVAGAGGGGGGGAQSYTAGLEPLVGGNGGSGFVAIYM